MSKKYERVVWAVASEWTCRRRSWEWNLPPDKTFATSETPTTFSTSGSAILKGKTYKIWIYILNFCFSYCHSFLFKYLNGDKSPLDSFIFLPLKLISPLSVKTMPRCNTRDKKSWLIHLKFFFLNAFLSQNV